jgi:hypothetical protein
MTAFQDFSKPIELERACEAVLIPQGTRVTLDAGTTVFVTQALGGSVTVNVNGNLARIPAHEVDAGHDAGATASAGGRWERRDRG